MKLLQLWRWITKPAPLLALLIILITVVVVIASYAWSLEVNQILTLTVAALAFPVALLTQRSILVENQKHELSRKGYESLQGPIDRVRDSLVTILQIKNSSPAPSKVVEYGIELRKATASFTDTFHYNEMIFTKKVALQVEYLHYTLMKLAFTLDHANDNTAILTGTYSEEGIAAIAQAEDIALDLAGYMYDLNINLIEGLEFDKIFNRVIPKRQLKDDSKTLSQISNKKNLLILKKELGIE